MTLDIKTSADAAAFKDRQRAKLAAAAGQIADFFQSYPEETAVTAIAQHINQFWSRRMRADFLGGFDEHSAGLHPLVRKALPLVKPAAMSP